MNAPAAIDGQSATEANAAPGGFAARQSNVDWSAASRPMVTLVLGLAGWEPVGRYVLTNPMFFVPDAVVQIGHSQEDLRLVRAMSGTPPTTSAG